MVGVNLSLCAIIFVRHNPPGVVICLGGGTGYTDNIQATCMFPSMGHIELLQKEVSLPLQTIALI